MDRVEQLRESLAYRSLTLHSVSQKTAAVFGRYSPFYIPHNWYRRLARSQSIATIHQVLALSHLTNFCFSDWLAVLGYDLDPILGFQLRITRRWTTILDSISHASEDWVPWFADREFTRPTPAIAPLGVIVKWARARRAADLLATHGRFSYFVIGENDVYAVPYFVPGSIVRVDRRRAEQELVSAQTGRDGPFFLVEHNRGWTCSRLTVLGGNRILLHCPQRPCAERELQVGTNARVLGAVDAEIRPVAQRSSSTCLTAGDQAEDKVRPEEFLDEPTSLGNLLVKSRMNAGLSFREASSISRAIADSLSNKHYFIAPGTLSDYETLREPPRHIPKMIALSLIYAINFDRLLQFSGLPLEMAGQEFMPDGIMGRRVPGANHKARGRIQNTAPNPNGFLNTLLAQWEEIPLFLRFALDALTGLKDFSLSDVFWVGGDRLQPHPLLHDAAFVSINRRAKRPTSPDGGSACRESLFIVLRRNGTYICGHCTLEGGSLKVHGYPRGHVASQSFRNEIDAEVVGQVTTILRKIG